MVKDLQQSLYDAYDQYGGVTCRRLFDTFIEFFARRHESLNKLGICTNSLINGDKVNKTGTVIHFVQCPIKQNILTEFKSEYKETGLLWQECNRLMNFYVHGNEVYFEFNLIKFIILILRLWKLLCLEIFISAKTSLQN